MKKVVHVLYHRESDDSPYEPYTRLLRDSLKQLNDIGKDADIRGSQKVRFLIDCIKTNNYEMKIGKVSVMNVNVTGGMDTNFEKAVSYLDNCLTTTQTTHINISAVDTYLDNKIEAQ